MADTKFVQRCSIRPHHLRRSTGNAFVGTDLPGGPNGVTDRTERNKRISTNANLAHELSTGTAGRANVGIGPYGEERKEPSGAGTER